MFIEIDPALGRNEPDYEIRRLLKASAGLNLAIDYLPGSVMFDPAARDKATAPEARCRLVRCIYAKCRSHRRRNTNLLVWHRKLYPIDHGAALFFHHDWDCMEEKIAAPFAEIRNHVAVAMGGADSRGRKLVAREQLTAKLIEENRQD